MPHVQFPIFRFSLPLAQAQPWEDAPPPPAETAPAVRHQMSFSDLQQGLHDVRTGKAGDGGFRNGILILLAFIALIALVLHFKQRHKNAAPPNSLTRLGRELGGLVHFPLGTRLLLLWVARSTKTPFAALLLSGGLFDKRIHEWASRPTFGVARHWGRSRLEKLRPVLFG